MPTQGGLSVFTPWPPMPLSSPPPLGWLLFPLPRDPPFEPPLSWTHETRKTTGVPGWAHLPPFFIAPALAGAASTMKKAVKARQRTTLFQCWEIILISILGLGALPILSVKIISERLSVEACVVVNDITSHLHRRWPNKLHDVQFKRDPNVNWSADSLKLRVSNCIFGFRTFM